MKDSLTVGDSVFNSPVGCGVITDVTPAGFPQVNNIAVARLIHKTKYGKFMVFDPYETYSKGDWSLFLVNESFSTRDISNSAVVAHTSQEAIDFCNTVKSLPSSIVFDHDLANGDTSVGFIHWMIDQLYRGHPVFSLRSDFKYAVHNPDSNGSKIIRALLDPLVIKLKGN